MDDLLRVETDRVFVLMNKPTWHQGGDLSQSSETYADEGVTAQGRHYLIREAIPKGESFDDWSQLFAVTIEHPLDGELDGYLGGLVANYENACDHLVYQQSRTTPPNVRMISFFCGQEKAEPNRGEVAFFTMMMTGDVLVKNYHHIRVPTFRPDRDELGVTMDEIVTTIRSLGALQVLPK
ncbi:hypothetical protein FHS89_003147 [Rubricella aquisinus]|uniref:Uncharacterized protein n=1 Tax=Rubricella aquisinus TaxID=2028108 RepID=A0A840WSX2_9RHOB|nr:hypothetical protein [Rubricella aquisinus]MBB5517103.1 hypothetical protein [Rubricella aquisinus]